MVRAATHIRATAIAIGSLMFLVACGSDQVSAGTCNSVSIDPPSATLFIGDTLRLQGITSSRNQDGGCEVSVTTPLNWTTDSASVAITSGANGTPDVTVAAVQRGTATIHATSTALGAQGTSVITVREH